jgi:hypothetical protein
MKFDDSTNNFVYGSFDHLLTLTLIVPVLSPLVFFNVINVASSLHNRLDTKINFFIS